MNRCHQIVVFRSAKDCFSRSEKRLAVAIMLLVCALPLGRRCAFAEDDSGLSGLVTLLGDVDDANFQLDLLKGMREGLKGRQQVKTPKGWKDVYPKLSASENAEVRQQAVLLALTFGDEGAARTLRATIQDESADSEVREAALAALVEVRSEGIAKVLLELLGEAALRGPALRGLAALDDPSTPEVIVRHYENFTFAERQDAIATLISRPSYASALLDAVERKQVPRKDISAFSARQIRQFPDESLHAKLKNVWGEVRESTEEGKAHIARYKKLLTPEAVAAADIREGRAVFKRTCAQCHKLFDDGGTIGPELTGSNRANIDYVLENVLTPSAAIAKDYQLTTIITTRARFVSGIIKQTGENALTIQTANDIVVVSNDDIDEITTSPKSMMPDGLWDKASDDQVLALVKYLAAKEQVDLPANFDENAAR